LQLEGGVTVGFVEMAAGIFGVVGTAAWVEPADGACWTPGAVELPQAARTSAASTARPAVRGALGIERERVAKTR
jgi:hypothetical protein